MPDQEYRVHAVMPVPRWHPALPLWNTFHNLALMGIEVSLFQGAYYSQGMQSHFEEALENDVDLLVCLDGDSMIHAAGLSKLLKNMAEDHTRDAMTCLQVRRSHGTVMAGRIAQDGKESVRVEGIVPIDTAHFGCTVLRCQKLHQVPLPWFQCQPNAEGRYAEGKEDADIRFWRIWREAGLNLYLDTAVSIGHLEEVVAVHAEEGRKYQTINEWLEEHYERRNLAGTEIRPSSPQQG